MTQVRETVPQTYDPYIKHEKEVNTFFKDAKSNEEIFSNAVQMTQLVNSFITNRGGWVDRKRSEDAWIGTKNFQQHQFISKIGSIALLQFLSKHKRNGALGNMTIKVPAKWDPNKWESGEKEVYGRPLTAEERVSLFRNDRNRSNTLEMTIPKFPDEREAFGHYSIVGGNPITSGDEENDDEFVIPRTTNFYSYETSYQKPGRAIRKMKETDLYLFYFDGYDIEKTRQAYMNNWIAGNRTFKKDPFINDVADKPREVSNGKMLPSYDGMRTKYSSNVKDKYFKDVTWSWDLLFGMDDQGSLAILADKLRQYDEDLLEKNYKKMASLYVEGEKTKDTDRKTFIDKLNIQKMATEFIKNLPPLREETKEMILKNIKFLDPINDPVVANNIISKLSGVDMERQDRTEKIEWEIDPKSAMFLWTTKNKEISGRAKERLVQSNIGRREKGEEAGLRFSCQAMEDILIWDRNEGPDSDKKYVEKVKQRYTSSCEKKLTELWIQAKAEGKIK